MRQKLEAVTMKRVTTRQIIPVLGLAAALSLAGCSMLPGSSDTSAPLGTTVSSESSLTTLYERRSPLANRKSVRANDSFAGAVVADEPTAALAARDILEKGGNAADAATALYFALSVTYPAAAGLGGGGICLVHDADKPGVESISFLTRNPTSGGAIGIPGNVRGFALLHARHGKSGWTSLIAPAERMAATGFQASRSFIEQMRDNAGMIHASADLTSLYSGDGGMDYQELDRVVQIRLATTLALVRSQGVVGFYGGHNAARLVEDAASRGGLLSLADLRNYRPDVAPAQIQSLESDEVAMPASNVGAGAFAAALWKRQAGATPANLQDMANETAISLGAPASSREALNGDFGSTAFAAVDGAGGAVACAVTMNGSFGSGQASPETGVVFASSPKSPLKGLASAFLAPIMMTSKDAKTVFFVGAAAGAPKAAASIQYALLQASQGNADASASLAASPADTRSPASAIVCPDGLPGDTCDLNVNPKGAGVGLSAVASGE
ncbi:MAG: gamma-glutamyltransferase [Parvibaculum sp.]